ncbi:hypothetical protein J41TS12_30800 [Paenibacillus antibioticophila]|uniref:DUF58 domain-containing protein n=1 Tax=Paenibacillus antibioticophila TaxID=1274374 RepID=A0A919XUH3_9BACL|nr:DUF58 domain-containing protein [Paenibacillus antibioticophila]GIO38219.1 hypothetical protein J41TS12_30800 [Paenibacillus antibioticophila]
MTSSLLPSSLLPRLERLSVVSKRNVRGTTQGKRRSGRLGASLEFADYREYTPGDDIRRFDWGVYRRTGKPFIRQYWDEQELTFSLYLDVSASMNFGNKLDMAKRLAAAAGYVALSSEDKVQALLLGERPLDKLPPLRGKASSPRLFNFLKEASSAEGGNLASAMKQVHARPSEQGLAWLFSDCWMEDGVHQLRDLLLRLMSMGQEPVLVQVISREELAPAYSGDLRLVDSELGNGKEVAMSGKVLKAYERELSRYTRELKECCAGLGARYVQIPSDWPLEKAVFTMLRVAGAAGN